MKNLLYFFPFCLFMLIIQIQQTNAQESNWEYLCNGKNLDNWEKPNGKAPYHIEDGNIIVGTSVMNSPNTFLATKKMYSDFILEADVKVGGDLNSGIQIRSHSLPEYLNGRVHGYQIEIDPSPRAFTGGVYDEARRGWMYPLSRNEKGRVAYLNGQWNRFRIEAIGPNIRTWVNGVMTANFVDDLTSKGFIALQVHSIGNEKQAGIKVMWKDLRILTEDLEKNRWEPDPEVVEINALNNQLTKNEIRKGWRMLWDGKTLKGWMNTKKSSQTLPEWEIENGILSVPASDGDHGGGPGAMITEDQFGDFELQLDFKVTKGANSGIKYFVNPDMFNDSGTGLGCEFQIIDDTNHPDAKKGINGNRSVASLYDLIPADNVNTPGRGKQVKGVGQWNHARIVSRKGKVEHWLNHEQTLGYNRNSQMFKALVAYSKYSKWPDFGQWKKGHILLQDHGDAVSFRNIKIREF